MRHFLNILLLFMSGSIFAAGPPPICASTGNDLCVDVITLTIDAACTDGCTEGTGTEGGENYDCASGNKSIWYDFVATATSHQVNVYLDASNGCFNGSVVWSGGCMPSTLISCHDAGNGPVDQAHLLTGLTINDTYLIQVLYNSGGPCGSNVDVCVEVIRYDPCDECADPCYAVCEWPAAPSQAQVIGTCNSSDYVPPMHERSRKECWTFTGNSGSVTFSAIVSSDCGGGQFTFLEWELFDAACTSIEGPTDIFADNTAATVAGNDYTVCYDMVFAECNISIIYPYIIVGGVLPIELLSFSAKYDGRFVELKWVTLSETNNDYFTICKSINGVVFEKLTTIQGAGNSNGMLYYRIIDEDPYAGTSYYRLTQVDYDGRSSTAPLISINVPFVHIDTVITIYSINGSIVNDNWDNLPVGLYVLYDGTTYYRLFKR